VIGYSRNEVEISYHIDKGHMIEGIRFESNHDSEKKKKTRQKSVNLERSFPTSDRSVFSDHFNLSEFSKRENNLGREIASLIWKTILETVQDENLSILRSGKHNNYFVLESNDIRQAIGADVSKIGIRRLRSRSDFESDEAYIAAVEEFENGIRIQDIAFSKGARVPELYFLIHEKDENGEHNLFCGMEHIEGLTLGQVCNPDGTIGDLEFQKHEVEENVRKAIETHAGILSWPFEKMISRVEKEFFICHDASNAKPPCVHRDCHEDNVVFSLPEGKPVIIDFDDGVVGKIGDRTLSSRLETYRGTSGDLYMTDGPIVTEEGKRTFNAIDNLKKYLDIIVRVVEERNGIRS